MNEQSLLKSKKGTIRFLLCMILMAALSACSQMDTNETAKVEVRLLFDGQEKIIYMPVASTVGSAIEEAAIPLNNLDEIDPPTQTLLQTDISVNIIRVTETYEVEDSVIPFTRQTVRNENLPEGKTLIIQPGANGLQRITYRTLFRDGKEDSRTLFKTETISEARAEIVMVGVQTPFTAIPIEGTLAYLSSGNAWVMEKNTGSRRPIVSSGDLDGRIFTLSPDQNWLLFSRLENIVGDDTADDNEDINSLWIVDLSANEPEPIYIRAKNVIHYAEWLPNQKRTFAYSTVEPRSAAPGWQANNDLRTIAFDEDGKVIQYKTLIESNAGGVYGWWGTHYDVSPDGQRIAYARPDSVGLVNTETGELESLTDLIPFQTGSDWAWVPGTSWDSNHITLFTVTHSAENGSSSIESSPLFDISAILPEQKISIPLVKQSGMFSYPVISPPDPDGRVQIAYLQAIFPEQSDTSRYRLMSMDKDGSNQKLIFPPEGSAGLDPQTVIWSPTSETDVRQIALIYQKNLWLINYETGEAQQITGDGLINRIDWK